MVGASMVLPGRHVQPKHLARLIERERPTVSCGVPTIWADLLHHARAEGTDLSSLRDVVVGGSACPRSLIEQYEEEFGVRLLHGWGMTEMSPIGTIAKPGGHEGDEAWDFWLTQGRLVCGVQTRVSGPEGQILPNDGASMGEIETRGPWITGAYHRQPDDSRFHEGWLRTRDVGVISPTGVLQLRDRTKDVIKSGGEWISSIELEQALQSHPDVLDAAVIGVEDERWGERRSRSDGSRLEVLPRTSVGKTDKAALRRRYAERSLTVERIGV